MSDHQIMEALTELRSEVEKKSVDLGKVEKLNAALDVQEKKSEEALAKLNEEKTAREELEAKYNSLEAELKRSSLPEEKKEEVNLEMKSFEAALRKGAKNLDAEEVKYLRIDNNEQGGFLAPAEYREEIIKRITEVSPVRQVARIITTSRSEVKIPERTSLVQGGWIGEGAASNESQSNYGLEKIPVNKMAVFTDITFEMMNDSAFNMMQEISSDIAEEFARLEGAAFVNGDSINKPEGLLTNTEVQSRNSGSASDITADSLFEIQGDLKEGYEGTFMFNRRTLHQNIRTLKDAEGRYLLQPGLSGELINTVAGRPYVSAIDMPDVAANATPVLFGDFRRGYYIVDNMGMETIEDRFTQARNGKVRIHFYKRTGGQVVLAEAIKKITIAA